ncbi:MAG TPA: APC family permease [Candidatus Angelobacter sp.]|jgi:amino acid transporter|nr:APC family permease [Candidatus Angelobacter sp.]
MATQNVMTPATPSLRRSLTLWHLIVIGIVIIQPIAPMGVYGIISNKAGGHVITTILIAMVGMLFTAISYGRMARVYPSAGSAYTYVGQEIHPALGYVTGWAMVMDYILNPLICTIICSKLTMNIVPLPYWLLAIGFAGFFSAVNLVGVKTSARLNEVLTFGMIVVVVIFLVFVVRTLWGIGHYGAGFFTQPFYNPSTFNFGGVFRGTSIAVLTYIGFDGISTLSEEVENPRRNILLATVLVCVVTGILSSVEVYAAQLIWGSKPFPDDMVESAFPLVARQAGGYFLFHLLNFTILVANIGSGMAAQLAAARLLYGMGRGNALPRGFFGFVDPKHRVPRNNVLLIGAIALIGAYAITYERGAELLNFGAFIAFMGVNAAAFVRFFLRENEKRISNLLVPVLGFFICAFIWWNLSPPAKIWGTVWVAVGIIYGAWRTNGFRHDVMEFDVPSDVD